MKWRAVLAVAAVSLLLALPLLALFLLWNRAPSERVVEGWRFIPWVTPGEARELRTLRQPCRGDAQCEPPLVCFHDPRFQQRQCMASGCDSDAWCAPYQAVCRAIPIRGRRMAVRHCSFLGTRREGEPCLRFPQSSQREWACGEGLVCAGSGWCGRRCEPGTEGDCPEGFFCARGDPDGPVCQPTCEGRACPEGQECLRREGGVSVCAEVLGRACHENPCFGRLECETEALVSEAGKAWRRCVVPCGKEGAEPCPEGFGCHQGQCLRVCSVQQPDACRAFEFCVSTDDEGNGVCWFSPEQWDTAPSH